MQEANSDSASVPKVQIELADDTSRMRLVVVYDGVEVDLATMGLRYQEKTCVQLFLFTFYSVALQT